MGRRTASRNEEMALMLEGTNPSSERVEPQPEGPHSSLEILEQQHENAHPEMEKTNSKSTVPKKTTKSSSKKRPKCYGPVLRRSLRFQDGTMPAENKNTEPVIEDIIVKESEKEGEQPDHLEENRYGPTLGQKSMEEKIDYLIQLLETMNSKARNKNSIFCESPDSIYKSLYADSQKIEALTDENHQLSLKLEIALAKLEAYENGTRAYSEMTEKLKDAILVSHLAKATETLVNVSARARGAPAPREEVLSHFLKRKRQTVHASKAAAKRTKNEPKN